MELYTKAFLVNLVVFVFVAWCDRDFLKGKVLDKVPSFIGVMIALWVIASFLSIPVWLIYQIVRA